MRIISMGIVALLLCGTGRAPAQELTARAILERAVKAHGGAAALDRLKAERIKFKGGLVLRGHTVPYTDVTTVQLPSQYKHIIETNDGAEKHSMMQIINGKQIYSVLDGKPQKVDPALTAEIRIGMEIRRAMRLLPLLQDKGYQLAVLDELKVNDRPAVGVRVAGRGRKEMRLYFDKEYGLLVRAGYPLSDGKGKEVRQDVFFGDYKDIGGCRRYTKVKVYRDGKLVMEAELIEAKTFDKIDEREFAKP